MWRSDMLRCVVQSLLAGISSVLATGKLTVPATVEADLGDTVTLSCRLQTEGRWYVIGWTRLHDNGSDTLLVSLPSGQMVPDWNPNIPKTLRMRVQPLITVQSGLVEFNLVISPLTCGDRGQYRCRAVAAFGDPSSVTVLIIHKPPGSPSVTASDHHPWTQNTSLTLLCEAQAGIPPQEFMWYFKTPRMHHFLIVERQNEAVYFHEPGCHVILSRALHVNLSSATGETQFRCALPGKVEDPEFSQDFVVKLSQSAVSVGYDEADVRGTVDGILDCTHPGCRLQVDRILEEPSGANQVQAGRLWITSLSRFNHCVLHIVVRIVASYIQRLV